jgi:hypothetical protein
MAQFSLLPAVEIGELAEDVRAIFEELAATLEDEQRAYSGECHPASMCSRPMTRWKS